MNMKNDGKSYYEGALIYGPLQIMNRQKNKLVLTIRGSLYSRTFSVFQAAPS
ncbi:hypothetical protein XCR1_980048 [Xenorhabdus cabanillasii JM26]|uniref:Uncharacterized protein n=1 Tax=Xenorhabdus cabanillasii JM26 TaxID=1427517 RepID=W1JCA3_9GAMM|nr:hypothetical protein XCR1_980048 [Xenorhabdus cabanillasii JM26]